MEKSVEIKLKSWEIKSDFLEIKLGNQPNPLAPPTFTTYDVIFEGNHVEINEKSGNFVHQNCSLPTHRPSSSFISQQIKYEPSTIPCGWHHILIQGSKALSFCLGFGSFPGRSHGQFVIGEIICLTVAKQRNNLSFYWPISPLVVVLSSLILGGSRRLSPYFTAHDHCPTNPFRCICSIPNSS